MPQVASELKSHALSHSLSHAVRSPQAADRAQGSPFESLLDEAAPPAAEQRTNPADESAQHSDRPQKNTAEPATTKSAAKPAAKSKSTDEADKAAKYDNSAEPAEGPKADDLAAPADEVGIGADVLPADTKTIEPAEAGDILKTAGDLKTEGDDTRQTAEGKLPEALKADIAAIAATAGQTPAPNGINAVAVAVEGPVAAAATPGTAETPAPATGRTEIAAAATQKAQPEILAALQGKPENKADGEKAAVDTKAPAKAPAPQFAADVKAAPASGEPKPEPTPVPAEIAGKGPRNTGAEITGATNTDGNAAAPKAAADGNAAVSKVAADAKAATPKVADGDTATLKVATDATQPTALNTPAPTAHAQTQAAAPAAAQPAPQAAAVPLSGVAIEITSKAQAGTNHFEIRLDPPELGRIQVHLEVDRDGNVTSRLIADRPDTLDLLRRDTAGLERALQDAGLKTSNNSLQFSLRDQTGNQQQNGHSGANTAQLVIEDETLPVIDVTQYARLGGRAGGIDISV